MGGVVDRHVQGVPIGATKAWCDHPTVIDRNAMGYFATGADPEKLTGVITPDPDCSFGVDAQSVRMAVSR